VRGTPSGCRSGSATCIGEEARIKERKGIPAEPSSSLAQAAWTIHEWACQPYYSLIVVFLFGPYFVSHVVADPVRGQALWSYTHSIAGFALVMLGPLLGAIADAGGRRKPWILGCTITAGCGCMALWWAELGITPLVILTAVIVATVSIELLFVFANAMLPSIASERRIGVLSGFGIALGQLAGMLSLVLIWFAIERAIALDVTGGGTIERIVGPVAGLWLVVFMLPLLLLVPDRAPRELRWSRAIGEGIRRVRTTLIEMRRLGDVSTFLAARLVFHSGVNIVYLFGGIVAATTFGWGTRELVLYGLWATPFIVLGGAVGGLIDRRYGARSTLMAALLVGALTFLVMLACERDRVLLFVTVPRPKDAQVFGTAAEWVYLAAVAGFAGAAGAIMASSRTLFARIAPPERLTELFGVYTLASQVAGFVGPVIVGALTAVSAHQKMGLLVAVPLMLFGTFLVRRVREPAIMGSIRSPWRAENTA